jgi:hypothetical protein
MDMALAAKFEHKFMITEFPNQYGKSKTEHELTIDELCARIEVTSKPSKAALPWLKFAIFGDKRTDKKCLRSNANVLEITGAELDYDGKKMTLDAAVAIARKAKLHALLYTSASYTDAAPKWRIVVPASKRLPPDERAKLVARINGLYGGIFDPASFTLSQAFYYGQVGDNPAHRAIVVGGDFIDERDDLDAGAIWAGGKQAPPAPSNEPINSFTEYGDKPIPAPPLAKMKAALAAIPNDGIDRKGWIDAGMAIKREYPGAEGWQLFRDWSATWTGWATPKDFDELYTRKVWDGLKPHSITAGALFRLADEATPGWRDAYEAGASKVDTGEVHASEAFGYSWTWHWHGETAITDSRPYLIQYVIPEVGTGVLAGQWGTLKTFLALDLAASVMSGNDFIQFPVRRQGGVLFIACEGESEVTVRLEAVLREKCPDMEKAPFAWVEGSPRLLDPNAAKILVAMIKGAGERMMQEFDVPPVLVIIDTTSKAAGYTRGGEDNDSAIAKIIERTFKAVTKACGLFILGVDHFGKDASVGTKGSSGKEDDVDVILAALGDKDITGQVSDTRLCLRKRRGGVNGEEFAYRGRVVDMGIDQYGSPMTTLVLDWETEPGESKVPRPAKDPWAKGTMLRHLRKSLMAISAEKGRDFFPADNKPAVQAVDEKLVRREFYARYMADGSEEQKADTRRKAFKRAVDDAQSMDLIGVREDEDGVTWIWMTNPAG